VLHALTFFTLLGVIKAVGRPDEITGNPANPLKVHAFSDGCVLVDHFFHLDSQLSVRGSRLIVFSLALPS
jgi:hypothetical protein